ncbi:uncharacterized protein LOC142629195 [Castanea sativa]|uniref:uncharacterized protein LOC142629195 n=1 Tax=Castanea sativa TaxID=21020 RepID=UPI003F6507BB
MAVFSKQEAAGLGVVIRDCCGRVIGAMAEDILVPTCAEIVEALAYRRALTFARELNISDLVFEGDAKIIIKSLLARDVSHPEYGHVIQDVLFYTSGFRVYTFTHVKRLGNSIAHFLAKRAKLGTERQVWFRFTPDDIAPLVVRDAL